LYNKGCNGRFCEWVLQQMTRPVVYYRLLWGTALSFCDWRERICKGWRWTSLRICCIVWVCLTWLKEYPILPSKCMLHYLSKWQHY